MFCINCGKEIQDGSTFCPECGTTQQGVTPPPSSNTGNYVDQTSKTTFQKAPYNTMCIIGLVISGISLLLNFFGLVGIAGTIVSVIGLTSCKQKNENGMALAVIGIVIGVFSIFYGVFALLSL
jgi:hypothetical protein